MRGEKNLGLWWIRAVRCFQVSFVFVLLPVRFFVFPATGNNAPAHTVPMVHGYLHRIWPPPDVITVLSLLSITVSKQPLLTDCPSPSHQDATDPMETLHVPHCWWPESYSPGTGLSICLWSSSPCSSCSPVALVSWFSWWADPSSSCSDRSASVIGISPWPMFCLSAMSPWFYSSIALMSHCHVTWPRNSVISHCHGILIHCYTNNQQPSKIPFACTLPTISDSFCSWFCHPLHINLGSSWIQTLCSLWLSYSLHPWKNVTVTSLIAGRPNVKLI